MDFAALADIDFWRGGWVGGFCLKRRSRESAQNLF
jgi:hypothetical protein